MTEVYYSDLDLRVQGHAGFAPEGSDIVCAAVSILCYTLAAALADNEREAGAVVTEFADGVCHISAKPKSKYRKQVQGAFEHTLTGLKLLETRYPKHVRVEGW